jgi:two-component system nitrogen regulation response regulator GlnG
MLNASGPILLPEFLPANLREQEKPAEEMDTNAPLLDLGSLIEDLLQNGESNLYSQVIETVDRTLLTRVLRQTGGHQAQASEVLGINRATLRNKLRSLGLAVDKVVTDENNADEGSDS